MPISNWLRKTIKVPYTTKLALSAIFVATIVFTIYVWFGLPKFENRDAGKYAKLATAFKQGHFYLNENPSNALLMLDDPYERSQRIEASADNAPWDISLYNKKFYLYWGPVPGILLMPITIETLEYLGDQWLVYFFAFGLFIYLSFFAYQLWKNTNQKLPAWLFPLVLLVIGLSPPILWVLNTPRIYEGAVLGSQFFLIGGCYWAYLALKEKEIRSTKLLLASSHWALALGTRITVLPVIFFATTVLFFHIYSQAKTNKNISNTKTILALVLPILALAMMLAFYNWQRFDSVFESGLTYQLTSTNYTKKPQLFSASNIKENLKNYFYYPVKRQTTFPYIRPTENTFSNERMAGLFFISPFLFFSIFSINWVRSKSLVKDVAEKRIALIFLGSFTVFVSIILTYYFPAVRFIAEFTPSLYLLILMSLGRISNPTHTLSKIYYSLIALSAIISVILSMLIAIPPKQSWQIITLLTNIQTYFK